jgi:hypothetical protein
VVANALRLLNQNEQQHRKLTLLQSPISRIAPALRPWYCLSVQRIKAVVALVLALVWLPAVSCCLIDASGLLVKQECCSKEHSHSGGPGNCDKPCGALASAYYLPQQSQMLVMAPIGVPLFDSAISLIEIHRPAGVGRELPATAPPELAGHWQFSFRTALAPRAPSFAS